MDQSVPAVGSDSLNRWRRRIVTAGTSGSAFGWLMVVGGLVWSTLLLGKLVSADPAKGGVAVAVGYLVFAAVVGGVYIVLGRKIQSHVGVEARQPILILLAVAVVYLIFGQNSFFVLLNLIIVVQLLLALAAIGKISKASPPANPPAQGTGIAGVS